MTKDIITIHHQSDVVLVCEKGRQLATRLGFSANEQSILAIIISEIANNILDHAQSGTIFLQELKQDENAGILVIAQDKGPGIPDIQQALEEGFSTGGGLGLGLASIKRLTDTFEVVSEVGKGTTVTIKKWKRAN